MRELRQQVSLEHSMDVKHSHPMREAIIEEIGRSMAREMHDRGMVHVRRDGLAQHFTASVYVLSEDEAREYEKLKQMRAQLRSIAGVISASNY
ncbi:hypothetical protein [Bacterioplanoides sp.]|uniref:hypothetical protein n=1 Tax=Bacterioplanoides sp. TaxID=2066072 RepID=UPI003B003402